MAFLKGLLVIDDLAIFGKSPRRPRSSRFDTDFDAELIAVDLRTGSALWTRKVCCHDIHAQCELRIESVLILIGVEVACC